MAQTAWTRRLRDSAIKMLKKVIPLLLVSSIASADFFLDLEVGMHANRWPGTQSTYATMTQDGDIQIAETMADGTYLGAENPLGIIRLGYEYEFNKTISAHGYFEHISSIPTKSEEGLNIIMVGGRINLSELFRGN